MIAMGPGWELRLGRWQDVMGDVEADCLITDPPYSSRVHKGWSKGAMEAVNGLPNDIDYTCWDKDDIVEFVVCMHPQIADWMVALTDHVSARTFEEAYSGVNRYTFAPVPCIEDGKAPRVVGDGPASWAVWAMVARPKAERFIGWGSLPGSYVVKKDPSGKVVMGGKPIQLMRALVRDYSRPGDLICDPCAGGGTTLLAALMEGRRAIGCEMDPRRFEIAVERLKRGYTPPLIEGCA